MCPPTHFDVRYAINPWMKPRGIAVDRQRALDQWTGLKRAIEVHASVAVIEAQPGLPDMCFTANAGFVRGDVFVGSRFLHSERRGEEAYFRDWFASRGYACTRLVEELVFEGAGDALQDAGGRVWMGYGQRSSLGAAQALREALDAEVVALQLIDPRFYHLDTCFCPLRAGGVVYFPGAFSPQSLAMIEDRFARSERIVVAESDATALACNIVDLESVVLLNRASDALRGEFEKRGIEVLEIGLSEFLKSGGAAKCLVLPLPSMPTPMPRDASPVASIVNGRRDRE
jgi:N-dimethylarginine dimethylaminohydrolase